MEGSVLFEFAVSIISVALQTQEVDGIVEAVKQISLSFGAINLEDISAPRCFEVEKRLKKELDIPVMHDDQHGTAIVVIAGLLNAFKLNGKSFAGSSFAVSGAGAAGNAITKMLFAMGARDIVVSDRWGILGPHRNDLDQHRRELLTLSNPKKLIGDLDDAMKGRDVFIGVSGPHIVTETMVRSMAKDPIVFALANPEPEIARDLAKKAGARMIATGRSDYPNQINNVLAYPGVFKGVLESGAPQITDEMKLAAARALAEYVTDPKEDALLPNPLDKEVARVVADAVKAV